MSIHSGPVQHAAGQSPCAPGHGRLENGDDVAQLVGDLPAVASIAEQLPVEVLVLDRDLTVRWANQRFIESWNQTPETLLGRNWRVLEIVPADGDQLAARVLAGETVDVTRLPVGADDHHRYVDAQYRPLRGGLGEVTGILVTSRDVTERCLAERALQDSEQRFRLFAESSRDLIVVVASDTTVRYVSAACRSLLGLEPEELVGQIGVDLLHPEDRSVALARLQALLTGDPDARERPLEYRLRHKDGSYRWVESLPTLLPADSQGPSILITTRDVSERRRVQEALEASEERNLLAVRAVNGVIWEWDLSSGRIFRSPGVGAWLGLSEEEVGCTDAQYVELIHPDDRVVVDDYMQRMIDGGDQIEATYRLRRSSGDYAHVRERALLLRDERGRPRRVVGFVTDQTEQIRNRNLMASAEAVAQVGGWEQSFKTGRMFWTDQVFRMQDLTPDPMGPVHKGLAACCSDRSRSLMQQAMGELEVHGTPFDVEAEMVSSRGRRWWARVVGHAELENGRPIRGYGAIHDITAQRLADMKTRNNSEMLAAALSVSRMSAWHWDQRTDRMRTVARSPQKPLPARAIDTLEDLLETAHPDDRAPMRRALTRAFTEGEPFTIEYRALNADGSWSWKASSARTCVDEDGRPSGLTGATQDISEWKRAELALRESEQILQRVTRASTDYLALLDTSLTVRFINRGVAGLTPEQLRGRHVGEILSEDPGKEPLACLLRVLATGQPDRYSIQHRSADGRPRHYEFRVNAAWDEGRIVGLTLNGSDVTEHILSERAIATQAKMIETMLEGVAVIDESHRIKITNPAFDRMFGHERGGLLGDDLTVTTSWSNEQRRRWRKSVHEKLRRDGSVPLEFEGVRRDGSTFAVGGVLARFDEAGPDHRLAVIQDVSERKALERAILEAGTREQYRIGSDLHDGLGQELTGVSLMLRGIAGRAAAECPRLQSEIQNVARLVSQAIESARSLARGLSPVDLERGSLSDALEGLAMQASRLYGAEILFEPAELRTLDLDPAHANHLYRIAQEAVTNAVRHGHAGRVQIELACRDSGLCLTITDDGQGLPEDAHEASGLGLRIMRYRASVMSASLSMERPPTGGTRVVCSCPVGPREAAAEGQRPRRRGNATNGRRPTRDTLP